MEVEGEEWTFPNLNISQDGHLVKWTFTAEELDGEDRTDYPHLQIWRGSSLVDSFSSSQSVPTGYPNVYEHVVEPPLPVKAGDYIGIVQPAENFTRLLISFVPFAGYYLGASLPLVPLVTVEVVENDGKAKNNMYLPFVFDTHFELWLVNLKGDDLNFANPFNIMKRFKPL